MSNRYREEPKTWLERLNPGHWIERWAAYAALYGLRIEAEAAFTVTRDDRRHKMLGGVAVGLDRMIQGMHARTVTRADAMRYRDSVAPAVRNPFAREVTPPESTPTPVNTSGTEPMPATDTADLSQEVVLTIVQE